MIKKLLYSIAFLLLCLSSFSQRKYVFTRISNKEGLASNYVYSVIQDNKGFMWFGTESGLQRYDGRKIIMFRNPEGQGDYLPSEAVSQILQDKAGNFWVRFGKDVGILDPATFRFRRATLQIEGAVPTRSEYKLWEDRSGKVFLIIDRQGYYTYDPATHSFSVKNNFFKLPGNWKPTQIVQDPHNNNYWISSDSGIALYDAVKKQVFSKHNNPTNIGLLNEVSFKHITAFHIDKSYRAWIVCWPTGTNVESYYAYDIRLNRLIPEVDGLRESTKRYHELKAFFEQKNGKIWAYGRMLFLERDSLRHRFNYIRNEHLDDFGVKYDAIIDMYEDREENIWLATDQGMYVFNPATQQFNSIDLSKVEPIEQESSVTAFAETSDQRLWVGTWGKGVVAYDSSFVTASTPIPVNRADPDYQLVWSICEQKPSGILWIGCQSGRLIIYNPANGQTQFLNSPVFNSKTIRQVVQDKLGNIWIGTQYGQLVKWQAGTPMNDIEKGFSIIRDFKTIIYKMLVDKEGNLWVCTHASGIFKIQPSSGKILAQYDSKGVDGKKLFSDVVSDIVQYNDSLFIIASGALNVLNVNAGDVRHITASQGLTSHNVRSLNIDKEGTIWLGMISGLSRFNFKKNIFTGFSSRDGLINTEFQVASTYQTRSGRILFGSSHDFIHFRPETITPSSAPPNVSITDFKLFNNYLPPDSIMKLDKVRLDHTQNSITVEFAALSFVQKDKISYYYKLEGVDEQWTRADNLLFANYMLLPPGNYTFKVYCENGEGIASENVTSLQIYIKPPFWNTWWFLLLMIVLLAGLIYLAHRMRVNRLLAMEKVRTRIARDLHDDMGSTLSTINILSEMAKMKVYKDSEKTGEYLNKISDNSSRMMEAMDDIVWSINPMNDNMIKITARMREFATGVLEAKDIDFSFRVDDAVKELKLDMEARRDFFLLFKEAVNNLAKYSQCRHATIDISVSKSKLLMKITDDGIGFDVASADNGNGLTNMRKRAQTLGGKLSIESVEKQGTRVELEVGVN